MHRFYCVNADFTGKQFTLTDRDELHHLRNVLRLKKNDLLMIFDGKGAEAQGMIVSVTKQQAVIQIQSIHQHKLREPKIILACALPKKSKFELIIEKATELGADEIIPLITHRTEIKLTGERLNKKQLRFQTIAANAAKQCQRATVSLIHPATEFSEAIHQLTETTTAIIPSLTKNTKNLFDVFQKLKTPHAISFLIGPEGDFTPEEYQLAHKAGCIPVSLGETVLRVETAAICSLSCANAFFRT